MSDISSPYVDVSGLQASIPTPAIMVPSNETVAGGAGTMSNQFALADHSHPRLTSTTYATLDANGLATVMFTRTFTNKPGVVMTEVDATGTQPLVMVVQSFVTDASGKYAGAVVKGYRSQLLPSLNTVSPLAILGVLTTGVNSIVSSLSNSNLFNGATAGATVNVVAIARSDVPQ